MDRWLAFLTDYVQVNGYSKSVVSLLYELLKNMNQDGKIVVNAALKRDISKKIQITVGSIDNMIGKMIEEGLLNRLDRGMYEPSKELKQIMQESEPLEMIIVYSDEGKRIIVNGGKGR